MEMDNICAYNKFGYCRYQDKCKRKHENRICENGRCEITSCDLRHPKKCKYYETNKYCKFNELCKYAHFKPVSEEIIQNRTIFDSNTQSHKEILAAKLNEIEELKCILLKKEREIYNNVEAIKKTYQEVAELQEMNLNRDEKIKVLESEIDKFSMQITTNSNSGDKVDRSMDEYATERQNFMKCEYCSFKSTSSNGLAIHMGRKHKEVINYP